MIWWILLIAIVGLIVILDAIVMLCYKPPYLRSDNHIKFLASLRNIERGDSD